MAYRTGNDGAVKREIFLRSGSLSEAHGLDKTQKSSDEIIGILLLFKPTEYRVLRIA